MAESYKHVYKTRKLFRWNHSGQNPFMMVQLKVQTETLSLIDNTVTYFKMMIKIFAEFCRRSVALYEVTEGICHQSS